MSVFKSIKSPFVVAQLGSLGLAMLLFTLSLLVGREQLFLALNEDLGWLADRFFSLLTYLAEGWIWIPYLLIVYGFFKKDLVFILLNFLSSTLLTQLPKNYIWPNVNRPIASGIPIEKIHTVKGVEVHTYNSFPSGHTATAYTLFFLTVYFFPNKKVFWLGLVYTMACAYSRVYLGQHFPIDLAGGIIAAILSFQISIWFRNKLKPTTF
jgi:membrane-associated phospholipid phosphatase